MTEKADISQGRKLSGVWVIPVLALVLGLYMVVHTYMTEGPDITIAFDTAEGLEVGKTKVKYRNVDMGVVEDVSLNEDFKGVVATVKLDRQALPLLREDTRFWVVTARVGAGQITGLGTLLSGAYIELAPGEGPLGQRDFVALERPPLTPADAPGLRLHLFSELASSVSEGDRVLYNGYNVGRVESRDFDAAEGVIRYVIFIDAPFHELVTSTVRFWDTSGVEVSMSADGFNVSTGSIDTLMLGGIAFGKPPGVAPGKTVSSKTEFQLYPSFEQASENPFKHGLHYVLLFDQSVKGLLPDAPVEFRGIPLGNVERVMVKESVDSAVELQREGQGDPIPVLIYLEPGRLGLPDEEASVEQMRHAIIEGAAAGMRATLESGNMITGAKFISVDYMGGAGHADIGEFLGYPTIPTVTSGLGHIQNQVSSLLDKLDALPLETTVNSTNAAIASLNSNLESLQGIISSPGAQQLPLELQATLNSLREAASGLSPDSELYQSLNSSMLRLNRSLGSLETLSRTLATQPNAAIMPSGTQPDPQPEVNK